MSEIEKLFLESGKAYDEQDLEKMMSFVTEDYSWFKMTETGSELKSKGKEQASFGLKMVFESDAYVKGEVVFAKAFGNTLVAYEEDEYIENGESVTRGTLGVYIYKDKKLARVFSFSVDKDE
jgi:hypothetical protein